MTVSWSNIADPSTTDWIALYKTGDSDKDYLAWMYENGSKTAPGTALASGSVSFTLPATASTGTYVFRLFAKDSYTWLATSNQVTVALPTSTSTSTPGPTNTPGPTATPKPTQVKDSTKETHGGWRDVGTFDLPDIPSPEGDRKENHGWFVSWIAHWAKENLEGALGRVIRTIASSDMGKQQGDDDDAQAASTATATPTATAQSEATATATPTPTATATSGKGKKEKKDNTNRAQNRSGSDEDDEDDEEDTETQAATATPTGTPTGSSSDPTATATPVPSDEEDSEKGNQGQGVGRGRSNPKR